MDTVVLDRLVERYSNGLLPLSPESKPRFIETVSMFFKSPKDVVHYYRRVADNRPKANVTGVRFTDWSFVGDVRIAGARMLDESVSINIGNKLPDLVSRKDDIYIDLTTPDAHASYVFIPKIGLYIHQDVPRYLDDHLLLFPSTRGR